MEIKDFIKDALAQIVDGVQEANTALKGKDNPLIVQILFGRNRR